MANKRLDGIKATQTKIAQYGPGEPKRAGEQAVWTKRNPNRPKSENPFLRSTVYTLPERARAEEFRKWKDRNSEKDDSGNPYCWKQP